jgi:death-on-curing protein
VKYLSPEQVLFIHSRLIDTTGGGHGIPDIGLFQSAVARSQATFEGKDLCPDVFRKAAALMESLAGNHPFVDGNKRTAIAAAAVFLGMTGYGLDTTQEELERFTLSVAVGKVRFDDITAWFKANSKRSLA